MDPVQLQMMQQLGHGVIPGLGMQAPLTIGGSNVLANAAKQLAGNPVIHGQYTPDITPLAPLNLAKRFGPMGAIAGMAGNAYLTQQMERDGLMPMGNAGSYMQAFRTRQFQQMKQTVGEGVAGQDAEGIYRSIRGAAALTGQPFNREQREAAHSLANKIAEHGPTLALAIPEVMDAMAGERGSVQAMAGQMMEANRYRLDPTTGQMGYSADSNKALVNSVFENMFAGDNVAKMQGMRAGDMGQLYRELSNEGLAGPRGSLRDRTVRTLQQMREEGTDLEALGADAGVAVGSNLEALDNADLAKLRENSSVSKRLTKADSSRISSQLKDYVGSLAAIREVFGENGNPNAPIPQLIGALEALTQGQMHKFDAGKLNAMVRDMQALSQLSGKSIDQLAGMNKHAADQGQSMGLGNYFASGATKHAVTTGQAFQEHGGATGYGALSREEAEQASMSFYNRAMASEMSNTLGALSRIEDAGGWTEIEGEIDTPEEKASARMQAIMEAARNNETTYIDPITKTEKEMPTKESEYRTLISQGAAEGVNTATFGMMLSDQGANKRSLYENPEYQKSALSLVAKELDDDAAHNLGARFKDSEALREEITDSRQRGRIANKLGKAGIAAVSGMSAEDQQDTKLRNRTIADALMVEAANEGVELSEAEALNMAVTTYGSADNTARKWGLESYTAKTQVLGDKVTDAQRTHETRAEARAGLNQSMSQLGPQGSSLQKFMTAVQKQGDKGGEANLNTLFGDMFGADLDNAKAQLTPELEKIKDKRDLIQEKIGQLEGASPTEQKQLNKEIRELNKELEVQVQETREVASNLGLGGGEGTFDRDDLSEARNASRELKHLNRIDQVRSLASDADVTDEERAEFKDMKLSKGDLQILAIRDRNAALEKAATIAEGDLEDMPKEIAAYYKSLSESEIGFSTDKIQEMVTAKLQEDVGSYDDYLAKAKENYASLTIGEIGNREIQDALIQDRRSDVDMTPTEKQVEERIEALQKSGVLEEQQSDKAFKASLDDEKRKEAGLEVLSVDEKTKLRRERSKQTLENRQVAEDQLIAENQLTAVGLLAAGQTLSATADEIMEFENDNLDKDPELRKRLAEAAPEDRAEIVSEYMDRESLKRTINIGKDKKAMEKAGVDVTDPEAVAKYEAKMVELERRTQRETLGGTTEGRQSVQDTKARLATITDLRHEYMADDEAVKRGGARGLIAVQQSKEAEENLQVLANKYWGGDVGDMVAAGGTAMTAKGEEALKKDFAALTPEKRAEALKHLQDKDIEVGDSLDLNEYRGYIESQVKSETKALRDTVEGFSGAGGKTYADLLKPTDATREMAAKYFPDADEDQLQGLQALSSAAMLQGGTTEAAFEGMDIESISKAIAAGEEVDTTGMTKKQKELVERAQGMQGLTGLDLEQLESLEELSRLESTDVKAQADAIGITEDEYRNIMTGESKAPELFKDITTEEYAALSDDKKEVLAAQGITGAATAREQRQIASRDRQELEKKQAQQQKLQEKLTHAEENDEDTEEIAKQLEILNEEIALGEKAEATRMDAAGFDPNDEEDKRTYRKRLDNQVAQDDLDVLDELETAELEAAAAAAKAEKVSPEDTDAAIAELTELKKEAEAKRNERMEAAGLDPESEEDIEEYRKSDLSPEARQELEALDALDAGLSKIEESKEATQAADREVTRLEEEAAPIKERRDARMKEMGLHPGSEKDVATYREQVAEAAELDQIETELEQAKTEAAHKVATGEPDEALDEKITELEAKAAPLREKQQAQMKQAGVDVTDPEAVAAYRAKMGDSQEAQKELETLETIEAELAKAEAVAATEASGLSTAEAEAEVNKLTVLKKEAEASRDKKMRALGLDPESEEDRTTYKEGVADTAELKRLKEAAEQAETKEEHAKIRAEAKPIEERHEERLKKSGSFDPEQMGTFAAYAAYEMAMGNVDEAATELDTIETTETQLAAAEADLTKAQKAGTGLEAANQRVEELREKAVGATERRDERMRKADLDPESETDRMIYEQSVRDGAFKDGEDTIEELRLFDDISEKEYAALSAEEKAELEKQGVTGATTAAEQLKAARGDIDSLDVDKANLAKAEELVEKHKKAGTTSTAAIAEVKKLQGIVTKKQERQNARMEAENLDPDSKEDIATYRKRLDNQGNLQLLDKRRKNYAETKAELMSKGMSEEDADTNIKEMAKLDEANRKKQEELAEMDLGDSMNTIADAFGVEETSEARKEFEGKVQGGDSEANAANQRMVAGVLEQVEGLKQEGLEGTTAIEKLDALTDEYNIAKEAGGGAMKELADKRGISVTQLDKMMTRTDFLGMDEKKQGEYTEKEFAEAMKGVDGRNLEEEVKEEEERTFRIVGGTVNFVGDVNGTGTFSDVTAAGSES